MSVKNRIGNANGHIKQRLGTVTSNNSGGSSAMSENIPASSEITSMNDARFVLIQKKRAKITDARDRLAEIAKSEDAREKLNKKKKQNAPTKEQVSNTSIKNVGSVALTRKIPNQPVLKLQVANPKLSMNNGTFNTVNKSISTNGINKSKVISSGKAQMKAGSLMRTVNTGISTQTVKKQPVMNKVASGRYHPLPNNPNVVTIRNDAVGKTVPAQNKQRLASLPQLKAKRPQKTTATALVNSRPRVQRQTGSTRNGMQFMKSANTNSFSPFQGGSAQSFMQGIKPARLKITTTNNYVDWQENADQERYRMAPQVSSLKRRSYDGYDSDAYYAPSKKPALSSNMAARFDQPQQPSSGYKVMVTNLHPIVTVEDIEELFGNVGRIKYARLIREGIAEVVFFDEMDAYRSVEIYHNRQLDGLAMNVAVVSNMGDFGMSSAPVHQSSRSNFSPPQPFNPSTFAAPLHSTQMRRSGHTMSAPQPRRPKSVLRAAGSSDYGNHCNALSSLSQKRSQKMDVAPDIHAIHHALFSGRSHYGSHVLNHDPQVVIKVPKAPLRGRK